MSSNGPRSLVVRHDEDHVGTVSGDERLGSEEDNASENNDLFVHGALVEMIGWQKQVEPYYKH